jgi:DNA-binding MarR family transcriptional regulator
VENRRTAAVPARSGLKQPGVLAWLRLARVFSKLEHTAHAHLRCAGLSVAQFDVLAQVGAREGCTQQELADALLVTKGNVTQLLDRMEDAGLLTRRQEGRAKRVCLTEAGRRLRERIVPEHEAVMAGLFAPLSEEEQRRLLALLRTLDRGLDDHAAQE